MCIFGNVYVTSELNLDEYLKQKHMVVIKYFIHRHRPTHKYRVRVFFQGCFSVHWQNLLVILINFNTSIMITMQVGYREEIKKRATWIQNSGLSSALAISPHISDKEINRKLIKILIKVILSLACAHNISRVVTDYICSV